MQKHGVGKNNRPTTLVIGNKEYDVLRKLNLDWKLRNDNPATIMGFKVEKVDGLEVKDIEVK